MRHAKNNTCSLAHAVDSLATHNKQSYSGEDDGGKTTYLEICVQI
jgi:hypothetical protein